MAEEKILQQNVFAYDMISGRLVTSCR